MTVRPLGPDDLETVWRLSQLAFGYKTDEVPTETPGLYGIDGPDGQVAAFARIRAYEQIWGGRRVRMGGIASVVVEPHARGRGLAAQLMRGLLGVMRESGQPVSALFPTGVGIYRPAGWEVVGNLDDTRIATRDLAPAHAPVDVAVRAAGEADLPAIAATYGELGVNGLLTRDGPEFPAGVAGILEHDVVSLAVDGDDVLGYASYNRGSGYREGSELRVWECHGRTARGSAALLQAISTWSTVAPTVLWRGPTDELALLLSRPVPPPVQRQPWMLRVVDAPAAVAARGFPSEVALDTGIVLEDPQVESNAGAWRLRVESGQGSLERIDRDPALPVLSMRGFALLYAGAADPGALLRLGHLDRPAPELATAFAGHLPRILDYF